MSILVDVSNKKTLTTYQLTHNIDMKKSTKEFIKGMAVCLFGLAVIYLWIIALTPTADALSHLYTYTVLV